MPVKLCCIMNLTGFYKKLEANGVASEKNYKLF